MAKDFVVTPWEVSGDIDYEKLIRDFGTQPLAQKHTDLIEKLAGKKNLMLDRKIFFSHRDLDWFLGEYQKGKPVALYTGRGPSGPVHLGHLMPWHFTKYLHDAFKCPLYFQMTDDEKFLFKDKLSQKDTLNWSMENSLDVMAVGFEPERTKIFIDTKSIAKLYPLALEVSKRVTFSTAKAVFGYKDSSNIGEIFFTSVQSAPAFLPSVDERQKKGAKGDEIVPVLIPCAIDQDPHFRVTRDVAEKIGFPKPAAIHSTFFPSLAGSGKMSASDPMSAIYTTDDEATIRKKVGRAFTGGRATVAEQRKLGGNPDICSVCQYLKFFFEPDDKKLAERLRAYKAGEILDGENKAYLADKIVDFLKEHQRRREQARKVLDRVID
ncbi:MAG: tryptophan--tRNA ligase [Candidatus Micrarchaeia archaeon]|jgi:tryptophanyl-tRNA synthetase